MKNLINLISCFLLLVPVLFSCERQVIELDVPLCIKNKIRETERKKLANPPAEVWEWKAEERTYYYISSDCCDNFNYLYDENCYIVCAPDGGLSGTGDGECPEFDVDLVKKVIWRDNRS